MPFDSYRQLFVHRQKYVKNSFWGRKEKTQLDLR
jgi:hypothetical protein